MREHSGPLTSLVKKLDQVLTTTDNKSPRPPGVFVQFLHDPGGLNDKLRSMAEKEELKRVSLCIGMPPSDYEVAGDADVTVVIYKVGRRRSEKVIANFALRKGELDEAKTDAIAKALVEALRK